jgi:hypothetical protein
LTRRLLNKRTDDSHYDWTKKWGAGQIAKEIGSDRRTFLLAIVRAKLKRANLKKPIPNPVKYVLGIRRNLKRGEPLDQGEDAILDNLCKGNLTDPRHDDGRPIEYQRCPAGDPARDQAAEDRRRLFALFGGTDQPFVRDPESTYEGYLKNRRSAPADTPSVPLEMTSAVSTSQPST